MATRFPVWPSVGVATLLAAALIIGLTTPLVSNVVMLLLDRSNHLPAESSIFSFEPSVINPGSSNYWLYGRDEHNYYHFTYQREASYVYIPVRNTCPGFNGTDVRTWCSARPGRRR